MVYYVVWRDSLAPHFYTNHSFRVYAMLLCFRSITDISETSQFEDECKQFIANYVSELQSILSGNTVLKHKIVVLKLLACKFEFLSTILLYFLSFINKLFNLFLFLKAIAVVSTRLASQILSTLSLAKEDLDLLTTQTDPSSDKTLRVSFIHFILSFIIDQTPKIIEKLLGKKSKTYFVYTLYHLL